MSNYSNASILESLTLGKTTEYKATYSPDLLQGVPRSLNRDQLNINANALPFKGEDVWYGYEVSWLNNKGKPLVAVAEFRFPCTSPNIIESKSFKLYLNSFNQTRFESWKDVHSHLEEDLSKTINGSASVTLFPVDNCAPLMINEKSAICIDNIDISVDNYDFDANLLASNGAKDEPSIIQENLVSHLLKSNCLITNQPDWATLYISYEGSPINHESLLKYLISFRLHNEFHEQCVERIFQDIKTHCNVEKLTVFARYTRRGGLDINPFRSTHIESAPNNRTIRQ